MEVNRETQALLSMRKGQAIGELGLDPVEACGTQILIGLLENGFEPQAANAQESFVASIPAIHFLAMPMMHTTTTQMSNPPHRQIDCK
jgi:hypothetical protein